MLTRVREMLDHIPEAWNGLIAGIIGLLPTAIMARLLHHHKLVQMGHRRFFSAELIWEFPTAIFCSILGGGLAEYLEFDGMVAYSIVGAVSWIGPRCVEVALAKMIKEKVGL